MNQKLSIKNLKLKIIFLFLLVACCLLLVTPAPASAQGFSLGINPPILQIEAQAPAKIQSFITLNNLSYEEVNLNIVFKPFTASLRQNGQVKYISESEANFTDPLIFQRMRIEGENGSLQSITLAPKQEKKLTFNIDIPKDEPPSDYYFSVIFVSKGIEQDNQSSSQNLGAIATNVLLSIGPKGSTYGNLEEFSVPFFLEKGPVPFMVRVKNNSEYFIVPYGEILIKNMFGQTVGKVDLLPVNVLSKTIRSIPNLPQEEKAASDKALWNEKFLLGLYTAKLNIALSDKGPMFSKTVHFFALPLEYIIGLLITIFILILITTRLRKRLND